MNISNEPANEMKIQGQTLLALEGAHIDKRKQIKEIPKKSFLYGIVDMTAVVALALVVSFLIKTFLFQAFEIPTGSMRNTVMPGDRIYVNKIAHSEKSLKRGDIIVFADPDNWLPANYAMKNRGFIYTVFSFLGLAPHDSTQYLIKRIIGVGGDRVSCEGPGHKIKVNGVPINEPYVLAGNDPSEMSFDVKVPHGYFWVMGDNRSGSADSRYHQDDKNHGMVPVKSVVGRGVLVVWPLSHFGFFENYEKVFAEVKDNKN